MAEEDLDIRTRVVNRRKTQADLAAVATSIKQVEHATDDAGAAMGRTTKRGFLMNQALFTARRLVYGLTLGLGVATSAAILFGFNFNRTMESNTVALSYLMGSEQAARVETAKLYDLAAKTPFQFADVTDAARRFLAFGFTVQQTNRYLTATADAMSAMGGDPEIMTRIVRAFGQIQAKGRLFAEEVLQLTEAGIPAYKFLQQELGLTGDQMARIGELGIPAQTAIDAIVSGMERAPEQGGFKGAAEVMAQTVNGQLSTIRDYTAQLFGQLTLAPFEAFREDLPAISKGLQDATEAMRSGGWDAFVASVDESVGAGGKLITVMRFLRQDLGALARILSGAVFQALWADAKVVGTLLLPVFLLLHYSLQALADVSEYLAPILALLVFWWLAEKTAAMLSTIWIGRNSAGKKLNAFWSLVNKRADQGLALARWSLVAADRAAVFMQTLLTGGLMRLIPLTLRMRAAIIATTVSTWLFNAALWANPIVIIVAGIIVLVGVLVLLEYKFQLVSRAVQFLWDKMKQFWAWLKGHAGEILKWLNPVTAPLMAFQKVTGINVPFLAEGGTVLSPGWTVVGEHGPEAMSLPRGARVEPLNRTLDDDHDGFALTTTAVPFNVDGRELAEIVFEHRLDRKARR